MSTLPASRPPTISRTQPAPSGPCRIVLPDKEIIVPPTAYTLAGFRAWVLSDDAPEWARICFLDGEVLVDMSGDELETHNKVKGEVGYVLIGLNKRLKLGQFYADGARIANEDANLSAQPDAAFATWETLESRRVRLVPRESAEGHYVELEGSPDWVLEVISDSSVGKDTRRLRELYFRAGVGEYWLIDARRDGINFQILVRGDEGFEAVPARRGGWLASPLFQRRFRLTRERGRMNLWVYTLEVKPLR